MAWPVRFTRQARNCLAAMCAVAMVCILFNISQQSTQTVLPVKTGTWSYTTTALNSSFLRALENYYTDGHDEPSLASLTDNPEGEVTVLLQITTAKQVKPVALDAMLDQTHPIHSVWIICPASLHIQVEKYAKTRSASTRVIVVDVPEKLYPDGSAGSVQGAWLHVLGELATDWVWVLDGDARPAPTYLETVWRLQQTQEYRHALLGTTASLLPANFSPFETTDTVCLPQATDYLPKRTQPVDVIHGPWLLHRRWVPLLTTNTRPDSLALPLAYYISHHLKHYGSVPSVFLPIPALDQSTHDHCKTIQQAYKMNSRWKHLRSLRIAPTAMDRRQHIMMDKKPVLFVVDGVNEAAVLQPLICRFSFAHVIVTGGNHGLTGKAFMNAYSKIGCGDFVVHDIDVLPAADHAAVSSMVFEIGKIMDILRPYAIIHIQHDQPLYHAINDLVGQHDASVSIGIPSNDVPHALWISELSPEALQQWNTVHIQLVIITDRRPHSLSRLLESSRHAIYLGDKVDLMVQMEQSADRVTRMLVNNFPWRQGRKTVRHRINKGGLMPAVVESWYPSSDHDYAVLLEDDIEVSPLFYSWAKYNILQYRYTENQNEAAKRLFGISLYSPRNLELLLEGRRPFDPNNVLNHQQTPYVSQVPCSWGAVYFPEHWREFHQYLTARLDDQSHRNKFVITVPSSRSERWKSSWKKYFVELVYLRGYVMVYPNFERFESFSTNHLEFGTHVTKGREAIDTFLVPLMQHDTILPQLPSGRLPVFEQLPVLDLWGQLQTMQTLETKAIEWHVQVSSCDRVTGTFDSSDLLCAQPKEQRRIIANIAAAAVIKTPKATKKKVKRPKRKKTKQVVKHFTYTFDQTHSDDGTHYSPLHLLPEAIDVSRLETQASGSLQKDEYLSDLTRGLKSLNQL